MTTSDPPPGPRVLASVVALATAVLPFVADWNETHLFNPRWTGHARFHGAQTMALGAVLGLLALYWLWRRGRFVDGVVIAGVYWVTQALALGFPGVALIDPEFADRIPHIAWLGGVQPNQLWGVAMALLLLTISLLWARRARVAS